MNFTRDIRRCALQALYQFDSGNDRSPEIVRESLHASAGDPACHDSGFALAALAWEFREAADHAVAAITPDWPTYRQPVIDRNIIRLAHYEMTHGGVPPKVAINEAVELAKEFSTERSPMFVNGVLDKIYRSLRPEESTAQPAPRHLLPVQAEHAPGEDVAANRA